MKTLRLILATLALGSMANLSHADEVRRVEIVTVVAQRLHLTIQDKLDLGVVEQARNAIDALTLAPPNLAEATRQHEATRLELAAADTDSVES